MVTIWGRKTSSNVQALMWCIGELGLEYQRHDVGHNFGGLDDDAFGRLNPNRTIPVLIDGDRPPPLWETGAILRYLADRYGPEPFWPQDQVVRANVDRWAEWAKIGVAMRFNVPVFWAVVRTPQTQKDPVALAKNLTDLNDKLAIADKQLSHHAYLAGEHFTLADIQLGHILYRYYDIDIEHTDLPNLRHYYERLVERPAFRKHVMISYEALREG